MCKQEEMHEQMSGYKRMRREHQAALVKQEERCKVEMEQHKGSLDKEYDLLLHNFTRELDKLSVIYFKNLSVCMTLLIRLQTFRIGEAPAGN